jgi:catechol 2,3-dioxygenase-like lactoylglutathione lyase family enzyme
VRSRGIPTSDQARALRFYTEQLGFEVATDQPFDDKQSWIELRIANAATRVVLFTRKATRIASARSSTVHSPATTCLQLIGSSATAASSSSAPEKQPWGEFAVFKDPDGNQFVLASP